MSESVEQAARVAGWKGRAEREAVAVLDGMAGTLFPVTRDGLVSLLALAWLQGASYGMHDALSSINSTFEQARGRAVTRSVPTWRCPCGTVNPFHNHICSGCGVRRPDWYEGEDCDHDD